ncbi:sigma 54 modulation/S30EA ribosomal C-terminal domain-containing protein [Mycobacterium shigaense]|uniref:Uncharacterized protein n=1 Tax=Mycobacterium shigaense TaxID=722731 RepID=A0A1Z4EJ33_9MYCO|nr:sigma 54 modulation/S30EA ribosomal C-terminal domain-containing protein [Mycobacterium shigaense]PRI13841.1 integrase [Mycobacterium shigaense]BAX92995.1 hypothetical protein MSG_02851 [Mycobacterium shigaense]
MGNNAPLSHTFDVEVTTHGQLSEAADYARDKVGELSQYIRRPVLNARLRLARHGDPAVARPVVAQANLDVDGVPVRAQVEATTAREAVDLLVARLRRRLERVAELRAPRRGGVREAGAHEWRHGSEPTHRRDYFQRPAAERRVIRRKSYTMAPCSIDEAAREMELFDYDFHLFTEQGSAAAAVLYRAGETGYRLALVSPDGADQLSPHAVPVTISPHAVPCLTEEEAADRMSLLNLPFLFYIDAAQGRANVLYHRYDGHYGVITPAG